MDNSDSVEGTMETVELFLGLYLRCSANQNAQMKPEFIILFLKTFFRIVAHPMALFGKE